jgi:hypothetical protein
MVGVHLRRLLAICDLEASHGRGDMLVDGVGRKIELSRDLFGALESAHESQALAFSRRQQVKRAAVVGLDLVDGGHLPFTIQAKGS